MWNHPEVYHNTAQHCHPDLVLVEELLHLDLETLKPVFPQINLNTIMTLSTQHPNIIKDGNQLNESALIRDEYDSLIWNIVKILDFFSDNHIPDEVTRSLLP